MKKLYFMFVLSLGCFWIYCAQVPVHASCKADSVQPLDGEKTAALVSMLYKELGPRLGSHLVEPNVVITLSGLRGSGNFLTHNLTQDERNKIAQLNKKIKPQSIEFVIHSDDKDSITDIAITNFKGAEYSSKLSQLPFVQPYDASTGLAGAQAWIKNVEINAKNYFKPVLKEHPNLEKENAIVHLLLGLQLGYPDQALLDGFNAIIEDIPFTDLASSKILYSDYYPNPQPNFSYFSQHEENPTIVRTRKAWGRLLRDFYRSSWHRLIAQDPVFKSMIKSERELHNAWISKK